MKISELLNEADPRNFDSDLDYYAALDKERFQAKHGKHRSPKAEPPPSQQDIEGEIAFKRGQQADAIRKKLKVAWHDKEGIAPNGQKYNKIQTVDGDTEAHVKHEMHGSIDYHWGAKKAVYQHVSERPDGSVHGVIYFVDNHKYGMWKPWKDEIAETATAGATSAGNIATVDAPQLSPGKARGKKSYIGDPWGGKSGTKAPPQPKVVQPKASNGTAKNALDMKGANLFGGGTVKRS